MSKRMIWFVCSTESKSGVAKGFDARAVICGVRSGRMVVINVDGGAGRYVDGDTAVAGRRLVDGDTSSGPGLDTLSHGGDRYTISVFWAWSRLWNLRWSLRVSSSSDSFLDL
jgi:hypothetical protein